MVTKNVTVLSVDVTCHCKWDCCENGACGCDVCHCGNTKSEDDIPSSFVNPNT